jgi:HD superfamily phosphodiesterase
LTRELLLEAAYFHDEGGDSSHQRAVLSAAIACEARVKEVLRAAAANDRESALVELLIAAPREYTLALPNLFTRR